MEMASTHDPWRKHRGIKTIVAFDITISTFSIFYNGKTLLSVFERFRSTGQEENWLVIFLILFFTFGIQILCIIFAMLLLHAARQTACTLRRAIYIAKMWCISSATFLVLLVLEFLIGLTTFEYNSSLILFVIFCIFKIFWRVFTIYYVSTFKEDLENGESNNASPSAQEPIFKLIVTNPENCDVDVTDNENNDIQLEKSDGLA